MSSCAICGIPGHACGPTDGSGSGVEDFRPVGPAGTLKVYDVGPGILPGFPNGGSVRLRDNYARAYGLLVDAPAPVVEAAHDGDADPVPIDARVGDVIAWVDSGPDPLERAARARAAELERGAVLGARLPRTTLVEELERRIRGDELDDDEDDEEPTAPAAPDDDEDDDS